MAADGPTLAFASQQEWADWLAREHQRSDGIWLKIAKKAAGVPSVTYDEALETALCYGWIDGLKRPLDGAWWLQKFTPRRPRSKWSQINAERAERLIADGRMQPAGLRQVEQARADGRWQAAYAGQRSAEVPDDLQQALDASPAARALFEQLTRVNRYAILYRVQDAKRPETRAARIAGFVAMLERGDTPYPQAKKTGS
jgi:uncharacterized protein YdeI (YjbR/CyaY-like superfamily)